MMNLLDMVNSGILNALGCDMATFVHYFPAARTMYTIFIGLGLGMLLLNFVWQLFKNFGLGMGIEAEDPLKLTMRTILFMLLTIYAGQITDLALDIGGTPYQWIVNASLPPIQFASFLSAITPLIGGMVSGSVALIALILIIILAWNYLKLLLEAAERYILLGVLVYTAPVAFALGGSQNTANIFKSWCRMLGGQIFLLLMNAWCLKLFTTMVGVFIADPMGVGGNLFVWMLCAIGFLKVSQKIDSFMSSLGINVGHTGGSMLDAALVAAKGVSGIKRLGMMGGFGGGKSGGGSPAGAGTSGTAPNTGFLSGGLAGAVGRKVSADTASNLAAQSGSEKGGIFAGVGGKLYNNSIGEPGGFASNVIGSVATGSVARNGMITGDKAADAFSAYMGDTGGGIPGSPEDVAPLDGTGGMPPDAADMNADIPMSPDGGAEIQGSDMAGGLPFDASQIPMDDAAEGIAAGIAASELMDYEEGGQPTGVDPSIGMMTPPIPTGTGDLSYGDNGASAVDAAAAESIPAGSDPSVDMMTPSIPAGAGEVYNDNGSSYVEAAASAQSMEQSHTAIPTGVDASSVAPDAGISGADSAISSSISMGTGTAIPMDTGGSASGGVSQAVSGAEGMQAAAFAGNFGTAGAIPTSYRDITMGGGRITGTEASPKNPDGVQFAMYHTSQYTKPDGDFSTVQSLDGAKWYKQYAQPAVERTPVSEKDGKVKYNEKIVQKLPKAPPRIDRI